METNIEAVTVIYEDGVAIGCIHRDDKTGHNILQSWEKMDAEEIAELIGKNKRIPENIVREEMSAGEDIKEGETVKMMGGKLFKIKQAN